MPDSSTKTKTVFEKSSGFAESVFRDIRDGDLPQTIRRDLRESYDFYLDDDERARLAAMPPVKRWFVSSWLLVKNLFLKLNPVRRLIFLAGVVLAIDGASGDTGNLLMGFVALLFVLGLELKDKLLAHDELAAGRAVQVALTPDSDPDFSGWDLWLHTEPANDVGGDLVDFQSFGDGRFSVSLGDVAGKGLGAALFMAKLQATVRAIAPSCRSLSELGARVNEIFCRDGLPGRFASLIYAEAEENNERVRILNAGHLPGIVIKSGVVRELERGAPAIGLSDTSRYRESEIELDPDDVLVLYSDGVTEARDEHGAFFGDERLRRILEDSRGQPAHRIGERILWAVEDFCAGARPHDDLSIAILRRADRPAAEPA